VATESRSDVQTANRSRGGFLRDLVGYLLSSVKIGYEEGIGASDHVTTVSSAGRSQRDPASQPDAGQCELHGNGSSQDDRDRRRDPEHCEGHSQEVSANQPGDLAIDPDVSCTGAACVEANARHDASSTAHSGGDAANDREHPASVEADAGHSASVGHDGNEVAASSRQSLGDDGAHRRSDSGCTDGDSQVCLPTANAVVRQVHNQSGEAGPENGNNPAPVDLNKAVWQWVITSSKT